MKLTLNWLKEYLNTEAPAQTTPEQIIEKLTALGLEVDDVKNTAALYAPFKVVKVREAVKHPDADRLRVCQVETENGIVQVVCGAPNARAGMTAIFAPSGTYIPGLDVMLQKGVIRGQESNGMLVSMREMKLSDEHDGIIDLDDHFEIGTPISSVFDGLDDIMIEISLTPDRADCAGIYGIARDLAAGGCGQLKSLEIPMIAEKFECPIKVFTDTENCPHFAGRYIRGVKNGESPEWLKKRLESIGLRSISTLVDITNYFCIGLNRPLHVYDTKLLKGDIRVQVAKGGEEFAALNDKSYILIGGETVITDENGVLGLGGIVGGTSTGCSFDTTDVFLEAAYFDPTSIAIAGRKHQIISDARYRFERGIDPQFTKDGLDLATQMIIDLCGGEPSSSVIAGQEIEVGRVYDFNPEMTEKVTGVKIEPKEQLYILGSLGFEISGSKAPYKVKSPSWRPDILGSVDLVEEIVRIYGFDNIEAIPVQRQSILTENALSPTHTLRMLSGRTLASRGMQECVTWSFMAYDVACEFNNDKIDSSLRLNNPISVEMDTMRPSILPNLINVLAKNAAKGYPNAAVFETGPVFKGVNPKDQELVACGVRHGVRADKHWTSPDVSRKQDAYDAKADALAVIQSINPTLQPQLSLDAPSYFHPGRSGVFRLGKNILANFGEIHPSILELMDITAPVIGFEVFLDAIPPVKKANSAKPALHLSPLQPVYRDFAFVVAEDVSAEDIISSAKKVGGQLVNQVSIFDVYQGKNVADGHKSVAIAVQFTPFEKTLTDKEIDDLSQSIIQSVVVKTGGQLRA